MTRINPSHADANMWFESQFEEQRNSFGVLVWQTFAPAPFVTFLLVFLLCTIVPLVIHHIHQELFKTASPLTEQTQESPKSYRVHRTTSLEALSPAASLPVGPAHKTPIPADPVVTLEAPVAIPPLVSGLKPLSQTLTVKAVKYGSSVPKKPEKLTSYRYTPENPHNMCGNSCLPPTVTGPLPSKCTHPNHIRHAPNGDEFELVSINDGLGRFDTIPMMGVLDQWEQDRLLCPDSIVSCHTNSVLSTLAVQSSCYSYEQVLYGNVIACMLEIFEVHAPKMLRNKKKIGGSYYYNLCEMLREPEDQAAVATFMMTVSLGKRPEMLATRNPWGECMKPALLSLWNIFHDLIELTDEELEETIESWARTAKEWSLAMIYLKMAHKRLWQESPLYLTGPDIYDSKSDSEKAQAYIQRCLRAGNDQTALACQSLAHLRQDVLCIHRQLDCKMNDPKALKKMTPYDIDLLRLYTAALGQLCTTGNMVNALVAWRDQRHDGMKKVRALAIERKGRDLTMQELAGAAEDNSEQEQSDSELSSISSISNISNASSNTSVSDSENSPSGNENLKSAQATLPENSSSPTLAPSFVLEAIETCEGGIML
ncbi:hypothetical protein TWF506_005971 [Arthrobotrys conoides]|uniref:Uncharacterized protein n=1 Tax=Arthrobotrys conoides TaxID=74498 RepID=A0AAN8PJM3_9PEZI